MGIQDFVTVFDRLDPANRGFVTIDQLMVLYESVYYTKVSQDHVEAAVSQICGAGSGGKVDRESFLDVLEEVQRRHALDEQAYWDFQALDFNGSHRIRLQDALTLFQEYHGDLFSLHTWHCFLQSRDDPNADVYFDEIRGWLCDVPSGEPSSDREVHEELSCLEQTQWSHNHQDYEAFKKLSGGDGKDDEEDDYMDTTQRHAKRKLQKWERQGLEAMLTDDGLEAEGEDIPKKIRRQDTVTLSELLEALETKYSLLTDLLVSQMAAFAANMESERAEVTQQIQRQLAKLTRKDKLRNVDSIPGASALLPAVVMYLMGDLRPAHIQREAELKSLRQKLESEGKSPRDIEERLKKEVLEATNGALTCGQGLVDLLHRKASERELLTSLSRGQANLGTSPWEELCHLQRQHALLGNLQDFPPAALAVGLAERPQVFKPTHYSIDRDRSEQLAKERLVARRGHAAERTTSQVPDVTELENSGVVNARAQLVAQIELRHHLEREALIHMLQGPESAASRAAGQKMSPDERRRQLTKLRSHHLNWKNGNSGDSAPNYKILQEAVGLYWADRQSQLEKQQHNVADSVISAAVMADLQQKQELDFAGCLKDMAGKKTDGLISSIKRECRIRYQEHFDNIAFIVLGVVELTQQDQEYIDALGEKYKAMRDQVFVFALREKHGHGAWNNMGREGRQAELQRLRKEEKKMRGDGRFADMASIIGPKSQALPSLQSLIGENKAYGKASTTDATFRSLNLLADLSPRFDHEQEALLSWLHSEEVKDTEGQRHRLRELICLEAEKFLTGVDGDYEAGLIALGLLERIGTVVSGRSMSDKEKQRKLAAKRVNIRKLRTRQGEPYKSPAEDKKPPTPGDKLSYQCALLRSMLRRQGGEQELLLRLMQDTGFGDLVEAAGLMAAEERWQRQAEVAEKQQTLDLSTQDGQEEHMSVLEEAAALRVVGVRAAARRQTGRALTEDEVATSLLTELQDLHDTELAQLLQSIIDMDESALDNKIENEKKSSEEQRASAVMTVLTRVDGDSELTDSYVKLVERKYNALCEALLPTVVDQQGGARQSQKQRDKQLQALRKETAALWDAEDAEGFARVLGSDISLDHSLAWLTGTDRGKFFKEKDTAEPGQTIRESATEDKSMVATVKHLLQRFMDEKDFLLSLLAGAQGIILSDNMKTALKSRLKRETFLSAAEKNIMLAALACGLAERQVEHLDDPVLEHDQERYRLLARHEYGTRQSGRDSRSKKESLAVDRSENREALQDAVLSLLQKKHAEERQLLVEMLIAARFEEVQRAAQLESSQQRADRLAALRARRQNSKLESSSDNLALLQEALVVLREVMRGQQGRGLTPEDDLHLHCEMMAGLLWLQNSEAEQHLGDFVTEELNEMVERQEQIVEEIRRNHCTNIAALVFFDSSLKKTGAETDPMVEALDGKYDALRDKLLLEALINQMGENEWRNLSERERMKRLIDMKLKERQLRREGKFDELATLLGDAMNNEATLKKLMGEDREEYERKLKERLEKRKQRRAEGLSEEECDQLEKEDDEREEEEARQRRRNVLEDLEHSYDKEREALMKQLTEGGEDAERERQKKMLQLKLQQRRLQREDDVFTTALLLNQHEQREKDRQQDRHRQEQLARERLEAARQRRKEGRKLDSDEQLTVTAADLESEHDVSRLQEMALTSLDLKHQSEREMFMKLLDEQSEGEYRNAAREASSEELADKMGVVCEILRQRGTDENVDKEALKEAVAFALELKRRELESQGRYATEDDLQTALLADLQEIQDRECSDTLNAAADMDADSLKQLVHSIIKSKEQGRHDNVVRVLLHQDKGGARVLGEEGGEEDEEGLSEEEKAERKIVKALEMKYDALRDKMIIEALIKQHGEAEWKRLSDLERQRKLVEMRRKERQLRHEGKMEEVEALLGQHLKHKQDLDAVLGESKQEQKRRLEERLARRRQLKAQLEEAGQEADDATLDAIQQQEEEEEEKGRSKQRNVLENLQMHFEDEKAALLASLHDKKNAAEQERERQRALVQLQRETQRLQAEEKLDSAALIFSLGMQRAAENEENLLEERDRQRQLARERMLERKRQILEGKAAAPGDQQLPPMFDDDMTLETALTDDGVRRLQEGTLLALDKQQAAERDTLMQLLAHCRHDKEGTKRLLSLTPEELRLKLTRGEKEHASWRRESAKKVASLSDPRLTQRRREKLLHKSAQRWHAQLEILGQALAAKLELERRQLEQLKPETKEEEIWEELCVISLADLQERQMMHFKNMQEAIFSKSKEELTELRKAQRAAGKEGWFDCLSALVFTVGDMAGETMSLADRRALEAKLEEEFQQQKQAVLQKGQQENIDAEAMLQELEAQREAKRQALLSDMARQRTDIMQRLQARKRRQAEHNNEAETALLMLKQAESQSQAAQERVDSARGHQHSLLQERLRQRRQARKRAAEDQRLEELRAEAADSPAPSDIARADSMSSMKREKTMIDTGISEDQQKAIYEQLMRQNLKKQVHISSERQRQEEMLKKRREKRKGKIEDEAAALFNLGERQKTTLEIAKKGERERQIEAQRERVSRVRYERTMTKKATAAAAAPSKGFMEIAEEEGHEKMEEKAKALEEKFKQQADSVKAAQAEAAKAEGGVHMDEKTRLAMLKERRKQKKQQRQDKE